jgi:transposase InsO family protein
MTARIRQIHKDQPVCLKLKAWIHRYNHHRPHQALSYLTPNQYHLQQCKAA